MENENITNYWIFHPQDGWLKAKPCIAAAAFIEGWRIQLGVFGEVKLIVENYDPLTSPESPLIGGCCDPVE